MRKLFHKAFMVLILVGLFALQANAQLVPLNFGATNNMVDEFGELLEGTAVSPGDLVQILNGNKGIFPPDVDGAPHANNPIIKTVRIGQGTIPSAGPLGKVAGSVPELADRSSPNNTNTIFARVFNAPTVEASSFYTDSSLYEVPVFGDLYGIFFIDSMATDDALDENDNDGDGLHNSWEKSYGTDLDDPDTDGDGMSDGVEILSNTDANNEFEFLHMVELIPMGGGDLAVMWDSSPGTTYQVEYTTNDLVDLDAFAPINPLVTATGTTAYTIITNGTVPEFGTSFRARVPQD